MADLLGFSDLNCAAKQPVTAMLCRCKSTYVLSAFYAVCCWMQALDLITIAPYLLHGLQATLLMSLSECSSLQTIQWFKHGTSRFSDL